MKDSQIATPPSQPDFDIQAYRRDIILENINLYCNYIMFDNKPISKVNALKTLLNNLNEQGNNNVIIKHYIDDRDITSKDVIKVVMEEIVFNEVQQ